MTVLNFVVWIRLASPASTATISGSKRYVVQLPVRLAYRYDPIRYGEHILDAACHFTGQAG